MLRTLNDDVTFTWFIETSYIRSFVTNTIGKKKNAGHHVALIIPFLCGQCVPVVPNDLLNAKFMTNGEVDLQQGFKTITRTHIKITHGLT